MLNAYYNTVEGVIDEDGDAWEVVVEDPFQNVKLVQLVTDETGQVGVFRFDVGAEQEGTIQIIDDGTEYQVEVARETSATGVRSWWETWEVFVDTWANMGGEYRAMETGTSYPGVHWQDFLSALEQKLEAEYGALVDLNTEWGTSFTSWTAAAVALQADQVEDGGARTVRQQVYEGLRAQPERKLRHYLKLSEEPAGWLPPIPDPAVDEEGGLDYEEYEGGPLKKKYRQEFEVMNTTPLVLWDAFLRRPKNMKEEIAAVEGDGQTGGRWKVRLTSPYDEPTYYAELVSTVLDQPPSFPVGRYVSRANLQKWFIPWDVEQGGAPPRELRHYLKLSEAIALEVGEAMDAILKKRAGDMDEDTY